MKKLLSVAASATLGASALVLSTPGTAVAGNCTPIDGGGYLHYFCGKVFNRATKSVAVAKGSPSTFYKYVAPGGYAGSDGYGTPGVDIDGFRIPFGCSMTWTYVGSAPSRYSTDGVGAWYKINDLTQVTIKTVTC
ncbi:hypothetical protein [Motilibacter aurantiacus]|uniref:hypothetical protein n=1 Tax=Motilibacter aurantiacus TaxID=2714955 RepID=UPI00140B49F2|nr:hypothetical protein [Motilibacter aurantiacus]NHC45340.1 hypothetical protein [Motilibacter aurantiacus]